MKHPKQPCPKECPKRATDQCRPNCEAWAEYEKLRNLYYIEKAKGAEQERINAGIERDRGYNLHKGKKRKKR